MTIVSVSPDFETGSNAHLEFVAQRHVVPRSDVRWNQNGNCVEIYQESGEWWSLAIYRAKKYSADTRNNMTETAEIIKDLAEMDEWKGEETDELLDKINEALLVFRELHALIY